MEKFGSARSSVAALGRRTVHGDSVVGCGLCMVGSEQGSVTAGNHPGTGGVGDG